MKKALVAMALGFLAGLCPCLSLGQGQFPLKYEEIQRSHPFSTALCRRLQEVEHLPVQVKMPASASRAPMNFYVARVFGKDVPLALDASRPSKWILYVDTNGDGAFSENEAFAVHQKQGEQPEFGPIEIRRSGGKDAPTARLRVQFWDAHLLCIMPAGVLRCKVRLEGEEYTIAIADTSFNGRYDALFSPGSKENESDMIAVERIRNGPSEDYGEFVPLSRLIKVRNNYYSVQVLAGGSAIRLEKVSPKMGALDVGCPDLEIPLWSDTCWQIASGSGGIWPLPAGKYAAFGGDLRQTDEGGKKWSLRIAKPPEKLENFEVAEGKTFSLKMGPPLTAKTYAEERKVCVLMLLTLVGQGGEEYSPRMFSESGKPATTPLKLKILDEAGKVLDTGSYHL